MAKKNADTGSKVKKEDPQAKPVKKIRSSIQASIEAAKQERQRELMRRRLDIARQGLRSYHLHRPGEAVKNFHIYLKILEEWKGVGENGLHPGLFDIKKDTHELLLLNGVYWALAKLYDRTTTAAKRKEFQQYLDKFLIFSKGMPHQPISAETLRKFLSVERPVHKEDFKNAYKVIGNANCFVATSLVDVCSVSTIPRLRDFRDRVLKSSILGRRFVLFYYRCGPGLADKMDHLSQPIRRSLGLILDSLAWLVAHFY